MLSKASSSGKDPEFSFLARVDKITPVHIKLNNVGKPTWQEHCRIWIMPMSIILKEIKASAIVVDCVSPGENANTPDMDA